MEITYRYPAAFRSLLLLFRSAGDFYDQGQKIHSAENS